MIKFEFNNWITQVSEYLYKWFLARDSLILTLRQWNSIEIIKENKPRIFVENLKVSKYLHLRIYFKCVCDIYKYTKIFFQKYEMCKFES